MSYIMNISRLVLCFIFLYSFITKLPDFSAFERAIGNFQLLPSNFYRPAALAFMVAELMIVLVLVLGGNWIFIGYIMAIVLLAVFVYALNAVLRRGIQTSCNCFGTSKEKVSVHDIWRNTGIILVALVGVVGLIFDTSPVNLAIFDWLLMGLIAFVVSLLLLNLRNILTLIS